MSKEYSSDQEEDVESGNAISQSHEASQRSSGPKSILQLSANKRKSAMVNFSVSNVLLGPLQDQIDLIQQYHMRFKFVKTESKIVRRVLGSHGFKEAHPYSNNFNLMWSGGHFRPYTLRSLNEFQKVNHFPRSFELTRKDKLYRNIQRMQQCKGLRHFDFVPNFFVLPGERSDFHNAFLRDKGPWIVKPVASSRGRGIFLVKDVNMVPYDEQVLVCRYIESPLLVNGFKFDCRIYVAVTSFDPLVVYMYKEGLARFSTVKYEKNFNNIRNLWMHLTNYSIQKNNENYVKCEDPEVDNFGSKWSFSALLRHLKSEGIDTKELMSQIEDLIVKTMLCVEFSVGTACRMFVPHKNCCFELFGFDVLIDENLKPWLLEVNLSPSLACESPLDLKIKANLITDLFNLIGFQARDPGLVKSDRVRTTPSSSRAFKQRYRSLSSSSTDLRSVAFSADPKKNTNNGLTNNLTNEELRMIREAKEEYRRRGKFVRVFPTPESWEQYSSIQEHSSTKNKTLHSGLFPELWTTSQRPTSAKYIARARTFSSSNLATTKDMQDIKHGMIFQNRYKCYEKKLDSWDHFMEDAQEVPTQNEIRVNSPRPDKLSYEQNLLGHDNNNNQDHRHRNAVVDFNYSAIIRNGDNLTKSQAREAFATYLERVQARLIKEIGASVQRHVLTEDEEAKQQEQMDLIVRFLKKAAANFSNPMVITTPSKKLLFQEKQRILARQLRDFIVVYRKETLRMSEVGNDDNSQIIPGNLLSSAIEDDVFHSFLQIAGESELEELLSAYTKGNQAASIFLGEKSQNRNKETGSGASYKPSNRGSTRSSKGSTWRDFLKEKNDEDCPPQIAIQKDPETAVKRYSQSLTRTSRPVSANPKLKPGKDDGGMEKLRPSSAVIRNNAKSPGSYKARQGFVTREYPERQTVALKQQDEKLNNLRNVGARNHFRHSSAPLQSRKIVSERREADGERTKTSKTSAKHEDADETFDSFVNYGKTLLVKSVGSDMNHNEIQRSTSTQTLEVDGSERSSKYFSQRESRRVDANVKRAQKAYYDAYLKQLCKAEKTHMVTPHPPSQPPAIKKPVNTLRMNRIMSKNKDKY
eukprot:gene19861-21803_t